MRPTNKIVSPADDEDGGPGRTFVKGRYTATRYQRRSAVLPRLSGEERTGAPPSPDPTVDSPWTKREVRPAPLHTTVEEAEEDVEAFFVDLRDDDEPEDEKTAPDRRTWYQRHSAGLPSITEPDRGRDAGGA